MRAAGTLVEPSVSAGAHACWRFDDDLAFRSAAAAFLAEGSQRNERVLYVADLPVAAMRDDLAPLGDVQRLVADGTLVLTPVRDLYEPGGAFDPDAQLRTYARLTAAATADGYAGLRVAADATLLVESHAARPSFLRYELAVDRLMSREPMTAMCAYDSRVLGPAVGDLFAVHPLHYRADAFDLGFRAYHDTDGLHLCGEIDLAGHDVFELALDELRCAPDREVVVHLADVEFIDVKALCAMADLADEMTRAGRRLRLVGAPPVVLRCCTALGLDALTLSAPVA